MWRIWALLLFFPLGQTHQLLNSEGCVHDICLYDAVIDCKAIIGAQGDAWRIAMSAEPTWAPWDAFIYELLQDLAKRYHAPYPAPIPVSSDVGYLLIRRTVANGTMHIHLDTPPSYLMGAVLFLNGDVAGGIWEWPRQGVEVQPECGRLVFWPNTYTHPKRVQAIRLGESRFIVTWFKS